MDFITSEEFEQILAGTLTISRERLESLSASGEILRKEVER